MSQPRVALIVESSRGYGRGLLAGIAGFAHLHGPWSIFWQDRGLGEGVPAWLASWQGDGIIARVETESLERAIERTGLPAIDLRGKYPDLAMPQIDTDNDAVARLAAEHLRERGFRNVAYCGFGAVDYSEERRLAFEEEFRVRDVAYHVYPEGSSGRSRRTVSLSRIEQDGILFEEALAEWVQSLPKPIGILACNDVRGQQLLNACRDVGVAVPDEVAVLGVDNDALLCDLCDPPLSSVEPDTERIGYEAAGMLDRMLRDRRTSRRRRVRVPPKGIVVRRSSDILAIEDAIVSNAVRYIREYACEGIGVTDVVRRAGVSQTTLNTRFRAILGHTTKREILRVRVDRAKRLLRETDLPQDRIAQLCGFKHAEYMSNVFRRETGEAPDTFAGGREIDPPASDGEDRPSAPPSRGARRMEPWQDVVFWTYVVVVTIVASRIPFYELQVARSPRLRPDDPGVDPETAPLVSILVPAKDEERTIEACLRSLLEQTLPRFEILVVDDRSTDRTAEIVTAVAAEDERVRLVRIEELPPGWTGKTHALQRGQEQANGEWLLFVDADVTLHPNCASVVLQDAIASGTDMETLVLGMDADSIWEGAAQPYAGTQLLMLYPPARINRPDHPGWGNGQFILVRREAYDAIGRHECVRDKFVEDIHLGRAIRSAGLVLRVAMASRVAIVRMYSSLEEILRGWARIFYSAVDFRPKPLWLLVLATIVFSALSYVVLLTFGIAWLAGARGPFVTWMLALGALHELLQLVLYWRIYRETRTPLRYLPFRVLGIGAMLAIHRRAIRMCRTHEVEWRGTTYGREIQSGS